MYYFSIVILLTILQYNCRRCDHLNQRGLSITKSSLKHQIAGEIRKAIFTERLKPGDKITETEISNELGVSRGPIREAIQMLVLEGLLLSSPYKETRVATITKEEVLELLIPIRLNIEIYALKKGFASWDEHMIHEFEMIIIEMEKAILFKDLLQLVELDIRFHEIIIHAAKNTNVINIWESIVNRIRIHFIYQGKVYTDLHQIAEEHQAMLNTFTTGSLENALEELKKHILDQNLPNLNFL
jgi:DNA-binding GntR family transcriptional regulator